MKTNPNDSINPKILSNSNSSNLLAEFFPSRGLSKREWFAGLALNGFMSRDRREWNLEERANICVKAADALIAELNKEDGK